MTIDKAGTGPDLQELGRVLKDVAERSGRAQDKEDGGGLETLRRDGYM